MSTISTIITSAVTLTGNGSYTSPLTITATGGIKNNNAVAALYAPSNAVITNFGQIVDKKGAGIYIVKSGTISNLGSAALISGGDFGIYTGKSKLSTITNQGTIQATSITGIGIYLPEAGFISNAGTILGGSGVKSSAIELLSGGTIQNFGANALIAAGAYGILASGTAAESIINQGTIAATRAGGYGISLAGSGLISNTGTISAASGGYGIADGGGTILNATAGALITGGAFGIYAGGTLAETIVNQGTIAATGDGADLREGGTIIDSGTITGGKYAVLFGSINSDRLIIEPGAFISGKIATANTKASTLEYAANPAAETITGLGASITGFATIAIDAGTHLTFTGVNTISGQFINDSVIAINSGATLNVTGSISGNGTILIGNGATLIASQALPAGETISLGLGGALLVIAAEPSPAAHIIGVTAGNGIILQGITPSVNEYSAFTAGIGLVLANVNYSRSGTPVPGYHVTLNVNQNMNVFAAGDGNTTLFGYSSIINGLITSTAIAGQTSFASTLTLTSQGTIAPASGSGVIFNTQSGADVFLNQGTIIAQNGAYGFYGLGHGTYTQLNFINAGIINGGTVAGAEIINGFLSNSGDISATGPNGIGVELLSQAGFDYTTLLTSGTISGSKDAVYLAGGSSELIVEPGAVFAGKVSANPTVSDAIELAGSSAASLAGFGTQITNFHDINFAAGARWTIEGNVAGLAAGQVINNFGQNTIILDGFVLNPNDTTFTNNEFELTSTLGTQITLNIGENDYAFTNGDGNTTIGPLLTILSTPHSGDIQLGVTFGPPLTITSSGTISAAGGNALSIYQHNNSPRIATNYGLITVQNGIGVEVGNGGSLFNHGTIISASGSYAVDGHFAGYVVNTGIILARAGPEAVFIRTLINSGTVSGGFLAGVNSYDLFNNGLIIGGPGGIGVYTNGQTVDNFGTIEGGQRLSNAPGSGGAGLDINELPNNRTNMNGGLIMGGTGAAGIGGATGAYTGFGTFLNSGTIHGGNGGIAVNGTAGVGGNGLRAGGNMSFAALVNNTGLITAGQDGGSLTASNETPGVGVFLDGATLINSGEVAGDSHGGTGLFLNYGLVQNTGTILGGQYGGAGLAIYFNKSVNNFNSNVHIQNTGLIISGTAGIGVLDGSASVNNAGLIESQGGIGVELFDLATFNTTGTIKGGSIGVYFSPNTRYTPNSNYRAPTLITSGFISGSSDAILFANNPTQGGDDVLIVMSGASFSGAVVASTSAADTLEFGAGASVSGIGTEFLNFSNLSFAAGSAVIEGNAAGLAHGQTISGFTAGGTIILDNFVVNTLDTTYVAGTGLELTDTLGNHLTLDITGSFSTSSFIVVDPPGDTTITAVCYLSGTRIATPGGERPIETLRPGDTVVTKFGGYRQIKWIGRQSYARQFIGNNREQIPVRISRNALAPNLPKRDLFVSPGHSMLIGDVLVLAKSLINGITICQDECPEQVDYFQLEFDSHDCIMAEGAWSESYADTPDWRNKFHNAAEFYALFPDHVAPPEQRLCAARPLAGFALARALRPIVLQAGIALPPGRLRGVIDRADANGLIEGWAQDVAYPHLSVQLEIWAGGRMAGHVLACDPREDLAAAGIGHGRCGFSFALPAGWPAVDVQVRRSSDGTRLASANAARTAA